MSSGALPDLVYYCGQTTGEELRYSLRSVAANLPHRMVWIAGYQPAWVRGTAHIPLPQRNAKHVNAKANLLELAGHGGVSDHVVIMNDDFYVLAPQRVMPLLHGGPLDAQVEWYARSGVSQYTAGLQRTGELLRSWGVERPLSYELHLPLPCTRRALQRALLACAEDPRLCERTILGNMHHRGGGALHPDVKLRDQRPLPPGAQFASTMDGGLRLASGREIMALFPEPCRYER